MTTYERYDRFEQWLASQEKSQRLWEQYEKATSTRKTATLVWFSKADGENTYHLCKDCGHYYRIRERHLLFNTLEQLEAYNEKQTEDKHKYQLCDWCKNNKKCDVIEFEIST